MREKERDRRREPVMDRTTKRRGQREREVGCGREGGTEEGDGREGGREGWKVRGVEGESSGGHGGSEGRCREGGREEDWETVRDRERGKEKEREGERTRV
jgi:hypothetical protein